MIQPIRMDGHSTADGTAPPGVSDALAFITGLVSTVLPVYNRPAMLREAVESVVRQTYRPIEIIVVDDGSTNETRRVIAELTMSWPGEVRSVSQTNAGPGPARNRGLAEARGEFIQYLDSDDLLLPDKFRRQVDDLRRNPDRGVSYCIASRPKDGAGQSVSHRTSETFDAILPGFLDRRGWPTVSPLWRREACERIGPWSGFRVMEDWEYDCRAGIAGIRAVHTPEVLCLVRDHCDHRASGTADGYSRAQWADYVAAYASVHAHLKTAGQLDYLGMVPFAKAVFHAARACAMKDHAVEARHAYRLARDVSEGLEQHLKLAGFRVCSSLVGWRTAAIMLERLWRYVPGGVA